MSRRETRRLGRRRRAWWAKALPVLGVLVLVGSAGVYAGLKSYLHSDAFRGFMANQVADTLGGRGAFEPFLWDGFQVSSPSFELHGGDMVSEMRADGLMTEVDLGGVRRGVWDLHSSRINRLEVEVDASGIFRPATKESAAAAHKASQNKPWYDRFLPKEVEVQGLDIQDSSLKVHMPDGSASLAGTAWQVEPGAVRGSYRAEGQGGVMRLPWSWLPESKLGRARLRYQDGIVYLTDMSLGCYKRGRVDLSGEDDIGRGRYAFQGAVRDVSCDEVMSETWSRRVRGDMRGGFEIGSGVSGPVARGTLVMENGVLTALPVLDKLAAYADTTRFRILNLQQASCSWEWSDGELVFSDLVLSSEGLVRLEGRLKIRGRELDGVFRLGMAPGSLATIPGAETVVFHPGERGLMWTPLRVTGTLDDPQEDLSARLTDAAGSRMFEIIPATGEKVLKFTRGLLDDNGGKTIEQGTKVLRQGVDVAGKGVDVIRDVGGGVLDGLLGGGATVPEPPKKVETPVPPKTQNPGK
jgi:hypothetical protein